MLRHSIYTDMASIHRIYTDTVSIQYINKPAALYMTRPSQLGNMEGFCMKVLATG